MLSNEQIIGQALDRIEAGYVFADKVEDIGAAIRRRLAAGEYDDLDGPVLSRTPMKAPPRSARPCSWSPSAPRSSWTCAAAPVARRREPRCGTNWEGVGVVPDVPVPADQALDTARTAIMASGA
ncbi:hypothetical protein [Micromonospora sp. ALFpr18c]|uniref:hypothetical protein n=1 Tax=unclassified Micromonospora TaxID=2617518 RepID=UPI001CEC31B3|nr:hypothetical protein [Micromonospora sp. ALFpr18c]